ncbi:hypothetical protein Pst134EB_018133 [Puccinia striiformis f. sp. tritici]|nr:hypothetical protein Pst134EB_018133 [Puccinia striiformis f. sp. tritici]
MNTKMQMTLVISTLIAAVFGGMTERLIVHEDHQYRIVNAVTDLKGYDHTAEEQENYHYDVPTGWALVHNKSDKTRSYYTNLPQNNYVWNLGPHRTGILLYNAQYPWVLVSENIKAAPLNQQIYESIVPPKVEKLVAEQRVGRNYSFDCGAQNWWIKWCPFLQSKKEIGNEFKV